jgi:glyoxylase-like metal-dependent hydrolase (beta-lactamase superfamily II)
MPNTPPNNSTRRHFLCASAATVAAALLPPSLRGVEAGPQKPAPRNAFSYRFNIGDIEAYSISDGSMLLREGLDLMWPEAARPTMRDDLIARGERTDALPLYVNILLLKIGRELVIFDGGFGPGKNPERGWVATALAELSLAPAQITHAFLSHAHVDHIGGFVTGNRAVFPNAAVYCLREEVDFWRSPTPDFSRSKRAKGPLPGMIKDAREKFDVLQPNLQFLSDGDSVLGGAVTLLTAPGHTSGHAIFRIKSGRDSLLHFMDVAHHHTLMFTDPTWGIAYDHEPAQAIQTRQKLFTELAHTHERAYGFHLPWPGLGRIAQTERGFSWQGERWSWGL